MPDIEKVIKGLECCVRGNECRNCPYREVFNPERPDLDCVGMTREDAIALLKEYRDEIDKLRRLNISLLHDAMHKDEIVSNTLKNARIKIEQAGQRGQKEQYHVDGEYGDHGWLHYCKGIRDACWAIDAMIKESEETT